MWERLEIPKVLGELVIAVNNYSQIRSNIESNKAFQNCLIYDNDHILPYFNEVYRSLVELVQENEDLEISSGVKNALELQIGKEVKLFNANYKVFDIDTHNWENKPLEIGKMNDTIILLSQNLKELKAELETQEENFGSRFEKELKNIPEIQTHLSQSQLSQQMENLVESFRGKLESKSCFPNKRKQRSNELDQLFANLPPTPEKFIDELKNIKPKLSKILTEQEIKELYQNNDRLKQLKTELGNLQGSAP